MKIYLASRSPRRHELLKQIDVDFEVIDIDIDESIKKDEVPIDYVRRISIQKARAGKKIAKKSYPVIEADTEVAIGNSILG